MAERRAQKKTAKSSTGRSSKKSAQSTRTKAPRSAATSSKPSTSSKSSSSKGATSSKSSSSKGATSSKSGTSQRSSAKASPPLKRAARKGEAVAARQRAQQKEQEKRRARREQQQEGQDEGAAQLGVRSYPANPLPAQHLEKPGDEHRLEPRPLYRAPHYRGSGKLTGRVALITGGDSGIGRAVAVFFAREGADIAIGYLSEHEDAAETQEAVEAEGRRCILIPGDVADPGYPRLAVQQTLEQLGRIDILVNNAAYQQHQHAIEDITDEQLERTFRTNMFGYFRMAREAVPHLPEGGVIINTGSITGIDGSGGLIDYASTKGAIHAFTKSLAQSLLPRGIRVNAVAPGPVWTPLNPADLDADKTAQFGADVPMKRPAQPEELAPAYVFLAAPSDSSYITGEIINVFGGQPTP